MTGTGMGERRCQFCAQPLPPLRWWQRNWFFEPPPFHDPDGPDGKACQEEFARRLGLE